jgi:hypothetical protein
MRGRVFALFGLLLLGLCLPPVRAEVAKDAEARLLKDLKFLTSDACEGRGIDTKGINLAAEYIERQFVNAGLKPGGTKGTYFQPFSLTTGAKLGKNNQLVLKGPLGQTLQLDQGKHFTVSPLGGSGKVEAAIVFAGYGITSADPKYDDYAGLDVAGKVVLVLTDTPRRGHRQADLFGQAAADGSGQDYSLRAKIANAQLHKAAAVLLVNTQRRARFRDVLPRPAISPMQGNPLPLPVAYLQRDIAEVMVLATVGERLGLIEKMIDADLKPRSTPLTGWTCRLETEVSHTQVAVKNVIGVLEGSGPLAQETVVIGAHYDHVGFFGTTRRFGGNAVGVSGRGSIGGVGFPLAQLAESAIHHGADDNASGTAALMELARHFGALKERKGRRLVFIAFTAEESGLLGSAYYCRQPLFPLQDTTTMINMDQIGRLQDNKLMIGGLKSAKEFLPLIEKLNAKHHFDLAKEPAGTAPSDNASFFARKVPIFWFFTGFHEQYHRPTDRVETLNVPGLRQIVAMVADVVSEVATMPVRPAYAKTPDFDRTSTLWSSAPSTGIVPDYKDSKAGVLVAEVVKRTPAAKAGLKPGDRIVELGGKKVPDASAFLAQTRALKPGEKVEVLVEREGKSEKIEMQLVRAPAGFTDPNFGFVVNLMEIKGALVLNEVVANSTAAKAGLKKGDRILALAGEPIVDRNSYFDVVRLLQPGQVVSMTVERDGKTLQFEVTTAKNPKKSPQ